MAKINNIDIDVIREVASLSESRICGFILYRTIDVNMVKVMRDDDCIRAFNDCSGERWPIFAVKPLCPSRQRMIGGDTPGMSSMVIMIEEDPKANIPVIDFFGLSHTSDVPCFVLFCWDDNNELLVTHYKLTAATPEIACNSILEVIEEITKSESQIQPEYRKGIGVYRQAREAIESLKFTKRFKRDSAYGNSLLSTLSSIFTIFHL